MKAVRIARFGGPEVLELDDVPVPRPEPDEVLIRVAAAGVNFAETLMREDRYVASYELPAIPGSEVAGTIEAVGSGVAHLRPGQRVGAALALGGKLSGGYAEFVTARAAVVAPLPDTLGFAEATGLLVQGLTANYLIEAADPKDRAILVDAAGGGVGSLLIQLARHRGAARILAAASTPAKRDQALANGADAALGYDEIGNCAVDVAYDSLGGEVLVACLESVTPGGTVVAYGAPCISPLTLPAEAMRKLVLGNVALRGFALAGHAGTADIPSELRLLFDLHCEGVLTVRTMPFPLEHAAEAHRALAERRTLGKVVLTVD